MVFKLMDGFSAESVFTDMMYVSTLGWFHVTFNTGSAERTADFLVSQNSLEGDLYINI